MPRSQTPRKPSVAARLGAGARRIGHSHALPVIGMLTGLIVAGFGLFGKAPSPVTQVPPGYIALVNGKGVLMSDFIDQTSVEMQRPFDQTTHDERIRVLKQMIDTELLVQRGLVLDLPLTTVEVRDVMQDSVIAQVSAPVLSNPPTEDELRAYFIANRQKYTTDGTMLVHDLVLHVGGYKNIDQTRTQAAIDAAEAVYQLRSGASIDYIEEHFGFVDAGKMSHTPELDFAAKIHLGAQLYAVAATLGDGQVSEPISTPDGLHVLVMDRRKPPQLANFDSVRSKVYNDYQQAEIKQATQSNLALLRNRARILISPGYAQ